ncbi:MAG: hypothetical protein FJZ86_04435 [Chloroflexi bacterium]|nr:hypothetical protein [Chloroflexota bacterium]
MHKFFEFLRRLFSLRNIAPLLIILGAIIGSLGLQPFGITFTSNQIIMALLAFLAIDALVERLEILTRVEQDIQNIKKSLIPRSTSNTFFKKRDYQGLEHLIDEARIEIWIAGITLDSITSLVDRLREKAKQGCNIRILALSPNGIALQEMAKYFASNPDLVGTRITSNLRVLVTNLRPPVKGDIQIKVLDRVFTTGYAISDPNSQNGHMLVQFYNYWVGVKNSPLFELFCEEDKYWYPLYLRQYERAWEHATKFEDTFPTRLDNSN